MAINFLVDGERADASVFNRPLKELDTQKQKNINMNTKTFNTKTKVVSAYPLTSHTENGRTVPTNLEDLVDKEYIDTQLSSATTSNLLASEAI